MYQIIDGKRISQEIKDELKEQMGERREPRPAARGAVWQ